jgi:hypothetical protein
MIIRGALPDELIALRPDQFAFVNVEDWVVCDFRINSTSQMVKDCPERIHPRDFSMLIVDGRCQTIQTRMTFEMDVIYVGYRSDPGRFRCDLTGDAVVCEDLPERSGQGPCAVLLPLWSGLNLPRGAVCEIRSPTSRRFELVDLVVRDEHDWVISEILVDGLSQLRCLATASDLAADLRRDALRTRQDPVTCGPLPVVPEDSRITVVAMYVGPCEVATFWACAIGRDLDDDGQIQQESKGWPLTTISVTSDQKVLLHGESAKVVKRLDEPVLVQAIVMESPELWSVDDVRVDDRSWFAYSTSAPSEALSAASKLRMYLGLAREKIEVIASYVGPKEAGRELRFRIVGSSPSGKPCRSEAQVSVEAGIQPSSVSCPSEPKARREMVNQGRQVGWDPYED